MDDQVKTHLMPGTSMGFRTAGQHMAGRATWQVGHNTVHCMLFQSSRLTIYKANLPSQDTFGTCSSDTRT